MKKTIFSLAILVVCGVGSNFAEASVTESLQPAGAFVINDMLQVNGSASFKSLTIGNATDGGVTFLNGTVVNASDKPVTIGDNLRVDGKIFRGEEGDAKPVKIDDHMVPALSKAYNLGSESQIWNEFYGKDVYAAGKFFALQEGAGTYEAGMFSEPQTFNLSGGSSAEIAGFIHNNGQTNRNVALASMQLFNLGGDDLQFTGMKGDDDSKGDSILFGFANHTSIDADMILFAYDDSDQNSRFRIIGDNLKVMSNKDLDIKSLGNMDVSVNGNSTQRIDGSHSLTTSGLDIVNIGDTTINGGDNLTLEGSNITLDTVQKMRFNYDGNLTDNNNDPGLNYCQIDGVDQNPDGVLVWGKYSSTGGLYFCQGGLWEKL